MAELKLPTMVANPDGSPTLEFVVFIDELINGTSSTSIGTLLSGVTAAQAKADAIQAGTVSLEKVVIDGRGDIASELDSITTNVGTAAASAGGGGALSASVSPAFAFASPTGGAQGTTGIVTIAPSGGTAPYVISNAKKSGDTFTVLNGTTTTPSFRGTPGVNASLTAIYTFTITDDVAATTTVDVSVNIIDVTS